MASDSTEAARREPGWIGRDVRTSTLVGGCARRVDGTGFDVIVHDISRDGCRIECGSETLAIGEWIEVEAPGLSPQLGQVRWALLGSAGLRFSN